MSLFGEIEPIGPGGPERPDLSEAVSRKNMASRGGLAYGGHCAMEAMRT